MELLAPAGDINALKAAVFAGADAVYLGLDRFNARMKADNFNAANLDYWVKYCHKRNVKVYVAINTIIKNSELDDAAKVLKTCSLSNVDAIIIQDLGLIKLARTHAPNCALHASTQLGIHNLPGAQLARKLGFSRVVLSRETTLDDIKNIKAHTDLEIEYFVHGALCVAFSGNCYFSSMAGGNSGNRGQCLQFCRKKYQHSISGNSGYLLSTKDQCMLKCINDIKQLGIDSIKIEGRMRSSEYVYSAVSAYRKAIDDKECDSADTYRLQTTFNRGNYTQGYAFGNSNVIYPQHQGNIGYHIGDIISCDEYGIKSDKYSILNDKHGIESDRDVINYKLTLNNTMPLRDGMACKIIYNGVEIGGFRMNVHGENSIITDKPYYKGSVRITSDDNIAAEIKEHKIGIAIHINAHIGKLLSMTFTARSIGAASAQNTSITSLFNTVRGNSGTSIPVTADGAGAASAQITSITSLFNTVRGNSGTSIPVTADGAGATSLTTNCATCISDTVHDGSITNVPDAASAQDNASSVSVTCLSDYVVDFARNQPTDKDQILRNIDKLGNTDYRLDQFHLTMDGNAYIPDSVINKLRRSAVEALDNALIADYLDKRLIIINDTIKCAYGVNAELANQIVVIDEEIAQRIDLNLLNKVIIATAIANYSAIRRIIAKTKSIYIKLPLIATKADIAKITEFIELNRNDIGILADNLYAVELAMRYNLPLILGFGMNISNHAALEMLGNAPHCLSAELSAKEFFAEHGSYIYAYGNIPIMTFAHCPVKLNSGCNCDTCTYRSFNYLDEHGKYEIRREKIAKCVFTMYNSSIHSLIDPRCGAYIDFTIARDRCNQIIKSYMDNVKPNVPNATVGRFKQGVK